MARGNTPPIDEARSIFTELGYTVTGDGPEFSARRDWKEVRVTAVSEGDDTPDTGTLRCFVTWSEQASQLRRRLRSDDPEYEWAVIGVGDGGDYEVARAPSGPLVAR
jgi:hypothetical protein